MILKALKNILRKRKSAGVLLKASIMYKKAIDEAESNYQRDGHRYYVIYDPTQKKLIALTYDIYMNRGDSYIYLRRRGRFGNPMKRNELKERCFYYTPSKNAPSRRCTGDEYNEKLLRWQRYYSLCLHDKN